MRRHFHICQACGHTWAHGGDAFNGHGADVFNNEAAHTCAACQTLLPSPWIGFYVDPPRRLSLRVIVADVLTCIAMVAGLVAFFAALAGLFRFAIDQLLK